MSSSNGTSHEEGRLAGRDGGTDPSKKTIIRDNRDPEDRDFGSDSGSDLSRGSCFCPECMRDEYSSSESFDGPIAPKRAQSAYFLWFAKNCDSIREKGMTATEVAQKAGQMWSELDRDAKQKFVKAAEEDRKRCAHETKEYRIMCESKKSKKLKTSAPKSPPPKRRWLYSDPDEASTTPEKGTPKRRVESDFDVGFTNRTKSGVKTRTGLLDESLRTAVAEEVANQLQPIVESAVAAAVKAATEQFANFFEKLADAAYNVKVATDNLQKVCAGCSENSAASFDNSAAEEKLAISGLEEVKSIFVEK